LQPCNTFLFFFLTAPAPTETYTLSLHDALPIFVNAVNKEVVRILSSAEMKERMLTQGATPKPTTPEAFDAFIRSEVKKFAPVIIDRKSTRLNSSHVKISYAVFCLKKKKKTKNTS